jgi:peptidoglycan/xylan/chitin deacetylase (PgdA/CDA1 family)
MKSVLMIHEIKEWMFRLPLEDYVLTFDDGLYSQYYYLDRFKQYNTPKYFFISTNIICKEEMTQSEEFPHCVEAHEKFFASDIDKHYMKWSQIKEIHRTPQCFIGGHSHYHARYDDLSISELYARLTEDTDRMLEIFAENEIKIDSFCYPYNKQYTLYKSILEKHHITKFFGSERVAIEDLR